MRLSYRETRNLLAEYRRYPSLALPGANVLRLRADAVATYRFLAENLRGSDPSFVTLPGLNSLYGWSERPLPGGFNATMNFALLTVPEQRRMIQVASSSKPICLVVNRGLLSFWTRGRFEPSGPLLDFMNADCRAIARVNGYELMCLKNTPSPVLTSCATLDEEWGPAGKRGRITATLRDHGFVAATASLLRISTGKSIPVRLVGRPAFLRGTEQDANASATVRQLTAEVDEASAPALRDLDDYLLRLRDEAGEIFAEVPFLRLPDEPR